jgi:PAS domain S-box-containing protein
MNVGASEMTIPRMQIEEQMRQWQALSDSAGEGIWGVDLKGNCTFVNRRAVNAFGFASEEMMGNNMHEMVHHHYPDGRVFPYEECTVAEVLRSNQASDLQVDTMFRKDGRTFVAEVLTQPLLVEGRVIGATVTFHEVTLLERQHEALRKLEKLAAVGQLASSIAHEINNPLESITNLLYLIRQSDSMGDVQQYARIAQDELTRVTEITLQTLRFHRQNSKPVELDLAEMLRALMTLYAGRVLVRHIGTEMKLLESPRVMALEGEIRQVVNNLLRNALDAMSKGGCLMIRLHPQQDWRSGCHGVRVTVADTGEGISPEIANRLFEPFQTTKELAGTGLGLWVSKGIVEKHGGAIRTKTRTGAGHGTVFTVWLPVDGSINLPAPVN